MSRKTIPQDAADPGGPETVLLPASGLTNAEDACGRALLDFLRSGRGCEIIEREDGFVTLSAGPDKYFLPPRRWPQHERSALQRVHGRILDVGCAAGRHTLHLQRQGMDAVGIDISPLAIEVCRARGLNEAHVASIETLPEALGLFDTVLMLDNNFGLFGGHDRGRILLEQLADRTRNNAVLLAESSDPHVADLPCHVAYMQENLRRNRLPGQLRLRVRYQHYATPWYDYLLASKEEMQRMLEASPWRVAEFIDMQPRQRRGRLLRRPAPKTPRRRASTFIAVLVRR